LDQSLYASNSSRVPNYLTTDTVPRINVERSSNLVGSFKRSDKDLDRLVTSKETRPCGCSMRSNIGRLSFIILTLSFGAD